MTSSLTTKAAEKEIVDIAEKEVERLVERWKAHPYLWDSERDIHAELYMNIKSSLQQANISPTEAYYEKYMNAPDLFHHIYCEPLVYVKVKESEKIEQYHPDIVIYKGQRCDYGDEKINEPMLWVCEIKYKTQWGGDQHEENRAYDEEKLRNLLEQCNDTKINGTERACLLKFYRTKTDLPRCDIWLKTTEKQKRRQPPPQRGTDKQVT